MNMPSVIRFVGAVIVCGLIDAASPFHWSIELVLYSALLAVVTYGLVDRDLADGGGTLDGPAVDAPIIHSYVVPVSPSVTPTSADPRVG